MLKKIYRAAARANASAGAFLNNLKDTLYFKHKIKAIKADTRGIPDLHINLAGYTDERWHKAYGAANGIMTTDYMPEDLFYIGIEPKLNPYERTLPYTDKNALDRLNFPCRFPKTLGRIMRGRFLGPSYQPVDAGALAAFPGVVAKPSLDTGGGKNVVFMTGADAAHFASQKQTGEYIFQEPLIQSPTLAAIAPDSVNTMRIVTLIVDGVAVYLSAVLRMGRSGSRVDNQASGGISCGIRDGRLITHAYDKYFNKLDRHPDTGIIFDGLQIPSFDKAVALVKGLHTRIPEIRMISWDVALDANDEPVIIEMNMKRQEINFHQLAHGPLFFGHTHKILQETKPAVWFNLPL